MSGSEDLRVVAFGGGTGLPVLLRGLKDRVGDLTAVVTMTDDGGSSGRLRRELGVAPPGDVRNCLLALARHRRLAEVFDYRFEGEGELSEHSVGTSSSRRSRIWPEVFAKGSSRLPASCA